MPKNSRSSKNSDSLPDSRTEVTPIGAKPLYHFTEDGIAQALLDARGDVFIAAQLMRVSVIRLHAVIETTEKLSAVQDECAKVAKQKVFPREAVERAIEERVRAYRVMGLDALAELATMPIDENSAQNQVKLAAAARLAGSVEGGAGSDDLAATLRELNREYQEQAPRLRIVRERTMIETLPPERDVTEHPARES